MPRPVRETIAPCADPTPAPASAETKIFCQGRRRRQAVTRAAATQPVPPAPPGRGACRTRARNAPPPYRSASRRALGVVGAGCSPAALASDGSRARWHPHIEREVRRLLGQARSDPVRSSQWSSPTQRMATRVILSTLNRPGSSGHAVVERLLDPDLRRRYPPHPRRGYWSHAGRASLDHAVFELFDLSS